MADAKTIRALNDALRTSFEGGQVVMTRGVASLPPKVIAAALQTLRAFDSFTEANDPYEEHDFGRFEAAGSTFLFKIDYYNEMLDAGSEDPADPSRTRRILTLMLSEEY